MRALSSSCSTLRGIFGARIEKHHDLILRKKVGVQVAPIRRGVEPEMVFRRHLRKPTLGFMNEADVCLILLGGEEPNHAKRWRVAIGLEE